MFPNNTQHQSLRISCRMAGKLFMKKLVTMHICLPSQLNKIHWREQNALQNKSVKEKKSLIILYFSFSYF